MTYAKRTVISPDRTRTEIERELKRHGAVKLAFFTETGRAIVMFEANDRRIRFDLPIPDEKHEQLVRSRWRALLLCIKAKMEAVDSKIETFEEAFLAHVVMPDGLTVGQHAKPAIQQAYKDGTMQPLLPGPKKETK